MADSLEKKTTEKKKKTKVEKIWELESSLKISEEENRRLRLELERMKSTDLHNSWNSSFSTQNTWDTASASTSLSLGTSTTCNIDKLLDVIKALKQVTVDQEMRLSHLRGKVQKRKKELARKDHTIEKLEEELKTLKSAQPAFTQVDGQNASILQKNMDLTPAELCNQESIDRRSRSRIHKAVVKSRDSEKRVHPASGASRVAGQRGSAGREEILESAGKPEEDWPSKMRKIPLPEFDSEGRRSRDDLHDVESKQARTHASDSWNPDSSKKEFFLGFDCDSDSEPEIGTDDMFGEASADVFNCDDDDDMWTAQF